MTQYPPPYVVHPPAPSNGLGIAGFIVSLMGIISCGVLSPVGFLLSGIGLLKRPRGFALAGFILGLLGTIWAVVAFVFVGLSAILAAAGIGMAVLYIRAEAEMDRLAQIVQTHKGVDGALPADLGSIAGVDHQVLTDPWGHSFRFVRKENNDFDITSDGPDGVQGNNDDLSWRAWNSDGHHGRRSKHKSIQVD